LTLPQTLDALIREQRDERGGRHREDQRRGGERP
jgi:hypothetical protein